MTEYVFVRPSFEGNNGAQLRHFDYSTNSWVIDCYLMCDDEFGLIIQDALNAKYIAKESGRKGGISKSPAKTAAARTNGTKGGRPRKQSA